MLQSTNSDRRLRFFFGWGAHLINREHFNWQPFSVRDHNHGIYNGEAHSSPEEAPAYRLLGGGGPVVIGENVWIGDNSVIIGPATIGKGAIVGANSVVRGVVPANTIVAGAPARPIKIFNSSTGSWDKV